MAKKRFEKKAIFAAIESTYGLDANPSATATKAILTKNLTITPLEGDELQRELDNGALGANPTALAGKHVMIEFDVDMAGSGTAGVATAYAPLIIGCGFAENDLSADATPRFEYDPIDTNYSALTFHTYIDNAWHKLVGARGTVSIKTNMKDFSDFHFKFMGLFVPVAEQTIPTRDYTGFKTPVPGSAANTELTVHTKVVAATDFSIDLNGELVHHETTAGEEILQADRDVKGSMLIEAPNVGGGEFDVWSRANDKTTGALLLEHGTVSGNIINISGPALEVGKPSYQDKNKIAMVQTPFTLLPTDAGNDEIKIITK